MRLIWDSRALADLRGILNYIAKRNPAAADRLDEAVGRTIEFLTINPFMYRRGRIPATREAVVHPNYIVVYRVDDEVVIVTRVLHARQNYP